MTRTQWILAISILALTALLVSGVVFFRQWQRRQAGVDRRFPLQELKYCGSRPITPCIVSFSQDADGDMLVSFLTDGAFYPDFYLKIRSGENDHFYVCQKVNAVSTSVYCSGRLLPVGTVLQFFLISINGNAVLAQGNFPIIGIALAGPQVVLPPTSTSQPTAVVTAEITPSPSYPSYP